MEDLYHYRRNLDDRQRDVSEEFEGHAAALAEAAEIRHVQCKKYWRFPEPLNSEMATAMSDSIIDFQSVCEEISRNIHMISTHKGDVFPANARQYLEQEIKREEYREKIGRWKKDYAQIREYGNYKSRVEFDRMGTTEKTVYELGANDLTDDLSDLSRNEECLRTCLVLGEIQREKSRLIHSLFTSPVQIGKEIGATVLISMVSLGASWGLVAGASLSGASFATNGVKNWKKASLLNGPEQDCKFVIAENIALGNDEYVEDCFLTADIRQTPSDIVHEIMTEDVPEETVMLSPYG